MTNDLLGIATQRTIFTSTRRLCLAVLKETTDGCSPDSWEITKVRESGQVEGGVEGIDFTTSYGERRATSLVPLLMQVDCGSRVFQSNLMNFIMWLDNANSSTRSSSLACIVRMAKEHRQILEATGGVIEMIEAKYAERMLQTTLISGNRHSSDGVLATAFGLLSGGNVQKDYVMAVDPDGSTGRGNFFTVLNTIPHETHRYVGMQVSHVHWFSTVRKWLTSMYSGIDGGSGSSIVKEEMKKNETATNDQRINKIPKETTVALLKYCLRVLEQVRTNPRGDRYSVERRKDDQGNVPGSGLNGVDIPWIPEGLRGDQLRGYGDYKYYTRAHHNTSNGVQTVSGSSSIRLTKGNSVGSVFGSTLVGAVVSSVGGTSSTPTRSPSSSGSSGISGSSGGNNSDNINNSRDTKDNSTNFGGVNSNSHGSPTEGMERRRKRTDKMPTITSLMESVDDISIEDDTTEAVTIEIIQLLR